MGRAFGRQIATKTAVICMPMLGEANELEAPSLTWEPAALGSHAEEGAQERFSPAFELLCGYMVLLFLRPHDYVPALAALHLPLLVGTLCAVAYVLESLGSSRPLIPVSPVSKTLGALTLWMILGLPFAYWRGGAFQTLADQWLRMLVLFVLVSAAVTSLLRAIGLDVSFTFDIEHVTVINAGTIVLLQVIVSRIVANRQALRRCGARRFFSGGKARRGSEQQPDAHCGNSGHGVSSYRL